jgi:hypothetical protein
MRVWSLNMWFCCLYNGADRETFDDDDDEEEISELVFYYVRQRKQTNQSTDLTSWLAEVTSIPTHVQSPLQSRIDQLQHGQEANSSSRTYELLMYLLSKFSTSESTDTLPTIIENIDDLLERYFKATALAIEWRYEEHNITAWSYVAKILGKQTSDFRLCGLFINTLSLFCFLLSCKANESRTLRLCFTSCSHDTLTSLQQSQVGWFIKCKHNQPEYIDPHTIISNIHVGTFDKCASIGSYGIIMSMASTKDRLAHNENSFHQCCAQRLVPLCHLQLKSVP